MRRIQAQRPLPELVYEALLDAICDGGLAPGARLTQDEVAERLNVSRLPVGQALKQLKADGFLVEAGRRGLKVAPLDMRFASDLYELRAGVEQMATGLAASRTGPGARETGEEIIRKGRAAIEADDVKSLIAADMEFHWFLYECAGNELVKQVMGTQWNHVRRFLQAVLDKPRHRERAWIEHAAILDAVAAADVREAERLARLHVEHAYASLRHFVAPVDEAPRQKERAW